MPLITNPPTKLKITKMKERVQWHHPLIQDRAIDQTRLVIADDHAQASFSFLVIGDTGWGTHSDHYPQRQIAQQLLPHLSHNRFLLHTGDVVYVVGSQEFYPKNFIQPYQELIQGGQQARYDQMIFEFPFLPVLGNHDYYDLPAWSGFLFQLGHPLIEKLGLSIEDNIGWSGSEQGDAYAKAFLDYLKPLSAQQLAEHLDQHYVAQTHTGRCLRYQPGHFTRVPNRYYRFQYSGIDFFALDSNTLIVPESDPEQLQWLTQGLIESWQSSDSRGRIVYCHHPAYVTEMTKWDLEESLLLRRHLRQALDTAATVVGSHPLVDLFLSGHAHCLEHIQVGATGHADAYSHWVICGGSGCSVRRQHWGSTTLFERDLNQQIPQPVAQSQLYIGLNGHGAEERHPYSFLQISVSETQPITLTLHPYVSEWYQGQWHTYDLPPIYIHHDVAAPAL